MWNIQNNLNAQTRKITVNFSIDKLGNSRIAKKVGYIDKIGEQYSSDSGVKQTVGIMSVQKSFESAKCIILNVAQGIFPKSTI